LCPPAPGLSSHPGRQRQQTRRADLLMDNGCAMFDDDEMVESGALTSTHAFTS
jgi:hypothetical protein